MFGIPPKHMEDVMLSDAPDAGHAATAQGNQSVNVVSFEFDQASLRFFAESPRFNRM